MTGADWATAVLLPLGAAFAFVGTVGLVRFPTLLGRVHAATKPDTVGLVLILAGAAFQLPDIRVAAWLGLAALFQFLTVPVLAQTLGRVAYSRGEVKTELLVADELADAVELSREKGEEGAQS
ncbi:monovalent cation/H(+) antiporter subunit G [Streptomonospora litoralis]|uniref:Na(+)/H(+) antiporter subunit G n=1 Tax=Streptomonospora litoralis TaxID=2498135 RepID=A0A4P6Q8H8_9ACTN|nr:monovalent cation/H(+) antiporter subunit G [Streptomonospora litoralis]QBI55257.1 Na(+)/H(+) antiporter subunit G [Streptomonospora litoralis]